MPEISFGDERSDPAQSKVRSKHEWLLHHLQVRYVALSPFSEILAYGLLSISSPPVDLSLLKVLHGGHVAVGDNVYRTDKVACRKLAFHLRALLEKPSILTWIDLEDA